MKVMRSARWVCADVHQEAVGDNVFTMKTKITFTGPTLKGYMLLVSPFIYQQQTYINGEIRITCRKRIWMGREKVMLSSILELNP